MLFIFFFSLVCIYRWGLHLPVEGRATNLGGKFLPGMYLQMGVTFLSSDFFNRAVNSVVLPVIVCKRKPISLNAQIFLHRMIQEIKFCIAALVFLF